jgi:hypothetical protein
VRVVWLRGYHCEPCLREPDRVAAEARGDTEPEARERGVQLVLDEPSRVELNGDTG